MYRSLLVSEGGGIIDEMQRAKQSGIPMLIIGLGGTGVSVLHELKRKLYRELEPDDPQADDLSYEHIRFLAIDGDTNFVKNTFLDMETEYYDPIDPHTVFIFTKHYKEMAEQPQFQWLGGNLCVPEEALPEIGKYSRMMSRWQIVNGAEKLLFRIKKEAVRAIEHSMDRRLKVYIAASLSGTSGSGAFIDVCYLVREALEGLADASIWGYFFLSDVITTRQEVKEDFNAVQLNDARGYAALKELDYLMNLPDNHGAFRQHYGTFQIETNQPPVDRCHLLSAVDRYGLKKKDGYIYSVHVAADHILSFMRKHDTDLGPMEDVYYADHQMQFLPVEHGGFKGYHILGGAAAEMPVRLALTWLAGEFYKGICQGSRKFISDDEVDKFAASEMGYTVKNLVGLLTAGVNMEFDLSDVIGTAAGVPVTLPSQKPLEYWMQTQAEKIRRNRKALSEDVSGFDKGLDNSRKNHSLASGLFRKLTQYAADPSYGPWYACCLLERPGKTISDVLHRLHADVDHWAMDARSLEKRAEEQVLEAERTFLSTPNTIFTQRAKKERFKECCYTLKALYRRHLDVILDEELKELLSSLLIHAERMNTDYFRPLRKMLQELESTFQKNDIYFQKITATANINTNVAEDQYTHYIFEFQTFQPFLDDIFRENTAVRGGWEQQKEGFFGYLLPHATDWLRDNEYQIHRMISNYIRTQFGDQVYKLMEDYMHQGFSAMSYMEAQTHRLYENAEPLFWCSPFFSISDNAQCCDWISVSDEFCGIKEHVALLKQRIDSSSDMKHRNMSWHSYQNGGRVIASRTFSGVPLYAYHGMQMFQKAYENYQNLHLRTADENWAKILPAPVPFSIEHETTMAQMYKYLRKAESIGILHLEQNGTQITEAYVYQCELPLFQRCHPRIYMLLQEMHLIEENGCICREPELSKEEQKHIAKEFFPEEYDESLHHLNEIRDELRMISEEITYGINYWTTRRQIRNNGTANQRAVCIDNALQSLVIQRVMKDSVDLYECISTAAYQLDKIQRDRDNMLLFCKGILTGVFKRNIGRVYWVNKNGACGKTVILADCTMPYRRYLLYQAYLSYCDLDEESYLKINEEIYLKINGEIEHRMDTLEDSQVIAEYLLTRYTPEFMRKLKIQCHKIQSGEEIWRFYNLLLESLKHFLDWFE